MPSRTVKYNVYYAMSADGPWTLANSTPIDHDQLGNEYTITGLKSGTLYYVSVVGGVLEDGTFVPLMNQHIGTSNDGAKGIGSAPMKPILLRGYAIRYTGTLRHKFEVI